MVLKNNFLKFDPIYLNEMILEEELKKIRSCIQCGECTASCLSGNWTSLKTRKIMRKVLTGDATLLTDEDLWFCTTCFQCYERCPRTIPVTDIIIKARNIAVREGHLPDQLKGVIKNVAQTGHAVPLGRIQSKWAKLRELHGLPALPPTVHQYPDQLEEIFTLLAKIKFNRRIPYRF